MGEAIAWLFVKHASREVIANMAHGGETEDSRLAESPLYRRRHQSNEFDPTETHSKIPNPDSLARVGNMAMRSALTSLPARLRSPSAAAASGSRRLMSDGKGRVLSEEERAKEAVYIQKMERERQEKLKKKLEQEKSEAEKARPGVDDKKPEGSN